jgi:hypothetical protein
MSREPIRKLNFRRLVAQWEYHLENFLGFRIYTHRGLKLGIEFIPIMTIFGSFLSSLGWL